MPVGTSTSLKPARIDVEIGNGAGPTVEYVVTRVPGGWIFHEFHTFKSVYVPDNIPVGENPLVNHSTK
jgi:hypothetical protein